MRSDAMRTLFDWHQGTERLSTAYASWDEVIGLFRERGVSELFVRPLQTKQDNEKNQIYFGKGSFEKLQFIIPFTLGVRGVSASRSKRRSKPSESIMEGAVPWRWISRDGTDHEAPRTRAILYLQYPELRLSGFIDKCPVAPRSLRRDYQHEYGKRVLVFGTGDDGFVYALVVTEREDPKLFPLPEFETLKTNRLFFVIELEVDAVAKLLSDLRNISAQGWIPAQRLKSVGQSPVPFRGTQGAGYTLEAKLGVPSNASKEPDRDGIEIKSYLRTKISLMTPGPDGGFQGENDLPTFLKRFGRQSGDDPDRWVFNGTHRVGARNQRTKLLMTVTGYDSINGFTGPQADVEVALVDPSGFKACVWSFAKLFEGWNRKHAKAAYVAAKKTAVSGAAHDAEYAFGHLVWICEGTNPKKLLDAILAGKVVYDPGDTSKSGALGKPKPRPQWRLSGVRGIPLLYDKVTKYEIKGGQVQPAT